VLLLALIGFAARFGFGDGWIVGGGWSGA